MICSAEHETLCITQPGPPALGPVLSDTTSWRNRDQSKLFTRLVTLISNTETVHDSANENSTFALSASLDAVSNVARSLFGEAGYLADRMKSLWEHDGQKGSRSMRKKALTDLVKLLSSHGVLSCSLLCPIHNTASAWIVQCVHLCPVVGACALSDDMHGFLPLPVAAVAAEHLCVLRISG